MILRACFLLFVLASCGRTVPFPKERLPDVMRLAEGQPIEIRDGDRTYTVQTEDDPFLVIEREERCGLLLALGCTNQWATPIARASFRDGKLRALAPGGLLLFGEGPQVELGLDEIRSLGLRFDRPDERLEFGVGLTAWGPSRLASAQFTWLPFEALALEVGAGGAADAAFFVWAGTKVRPFALGPVRPFVGGFVNKGGFNASAERIVSEATAGIRLGPDIELARHWLLTLEADYIFRLSDVDGAVWGESGTSFLTGGAAITYLF